MSRSTALRNIILQGQAHRREEQAVFCRRQSTASTRNALPSRKTLRMAPLMPEISDQDKRNNLGGSFANVSGSSRLFHVTHRREAAPVMIFLASLLKASASLEYARMAARIAFTFVPVTVVKNHFMRKYLRYISKNDVIPECADKKEHIETKIRKGTIFYRSLILFPIALFALTLVASLERAPLSGRWRVILLSPEEEDEIAKQLAGTGWYNAICEIISQEGTQQILPPSDWRYQWVWKTMRQLESSIPMLAVSSEANQAEWIFREPDDPPLPPPPKYPLRPRPSGKDMLRWFCEMSCKRVPGPSPHSIPGPPYSLLIVDRPDCDNAFSFGFGPDGGGGVVIYSGFLDQVLARSYDKSPEPPPEQQSSRKFLTSLLGSIFPIGQSSPPAPEPTPEQTSELAILIAHELSHLILSHHLETLSTGTVIVPGTLSMLSDLIRAVLFPVTMLFGPFVNDAVANMGKVGSGEFEKLSESCTSVAQEFEADAVSARLLAYAGFDARDTIRFWESRGNADKMEFTPSRANYLRMCEMESDGVSRLARQIWGSSHPVNELRASKLRAELNKWEQNRLAALQGLIRQQQLQAAAEGS